MSDPRCKHGAWEIRAHDATGAIVDREHLGGVTQAVALGRAQVLRSRPGAVVAVVVPMSRTGKHGTPVSAIATSSPPSAIRHCGGAYGGRKSKTPMASGDAE